MAASEVGEKSSSTEDWCMIPPSSSSPHPPSYSPPKSASPRPPSHSPPGRGNGADVIPSLSPENETSIEQPLYVICIRTGERIHATACVMVGKMTEKDVVKRPLCPDCLGEGFSSNGRPCALILSAQLTSIRWMSTATAHVCEAAGTCICAPGP